MKRAVNQWCYPEHTPIDVVFRVAQEAGLDGVELNIQEPDGIGITLDTSPQEARSVLAQAGSYGLELPSLSNGLLWTYPLSSPDADVRARGHQIVRKQLELAACLDIDAILVVPGLVDSNTTYEECWARSQAELAKLALYAESLGVHIAVENVWNRFLLSPVEMVRYIDELASPAIGAYFDVGNVLQFGLPEQWIRSLGTRIRRVHVKDFSTRVGNITGFVPLFAGDVNWPAVCDALRAIGYDSYITAELSPYAHHAYQAVYDAAVHMNVIARWPQA